MARLVRGGVFNMYAVVQIGGKQYKVQEGDVVFVDKLAIEEGEVVTFDKVLAVSQEGIITFGKPLVAGATVQAKVLGHGKGKKIIVFKYKPKKNYRRKQGHRQPYTKVQIDKINVAV
jgi:large subunit ribosomal protein L21